MEEAFAWFVGLDPFAVEDELGDGALAGVGDDLLGGSRGTLDVDFGERDRVGGKETLCFAAIAAPIGRIDKKIHRDIVADMAG